MSRNKHLRHARKLAQQEMKNEAKKARHLDPNQQTYLTQVRRLRKLSLDEASRRAHIPVKYIKTIEAHRWDKLPDPVYARAFIKRYAALVRVDVKLLLAQYDDVQSQKQAVEERRYIHEQPKRKKAVVSWVLFLRIGVGLLLVSFPLYHLYTVLTPPKLEVNELPSEFSTSTEVIVLSGSTRRATELYINENIQVFLDDEGRFSHSVNLQSGSNMIRLEARNRFGKVRSFHTDITLAEDEQTPVEE